MSEYVGADTEHTKKRGKIRGCDWCGSKINIGEKYAKWLFFNGGSRQTAYAHKECRETWDILIKEERGIVYSGGDNERPSTEERRSA